MKKNILIVAAFALSLPWMYACNDSSTTKETSSGMHMKMEDGGMHGSDNGAHDDMMKKMMDDMGSRKMSGDFDLDFANMMIPHHQSAVEMAEMYLPKAKDEKIKALAQQIIREQKKEIDDLKSMVANHKPADKKEGHSAAGHGADGHNELMDAMNKMMKEMMGVKKTGDADKDFALMMIPHHKSAVDMSENEISHGKHVEMKKFAQKMIDDQSKEIKEFEEWLKNKS